MTFPINIQTDKYPNIVLDYFKEDDAEKLYSLINENREYLREWLPWLDLSNNVNDSLIFIKHCITGYNDNSSLVLCIRDGDDIIGVISFHKFDWQTLSSTIGYWLSEKYSRKGIMIMACQAMVSYGFNHLNLEYITISCALLNYKSRKIPEKLRFKEECILPHKENLYGKWVDHILYSMTKKNYKLQG